MISREDNDVFGEMAWLTDEARTASVRCVGNVHAVRVDGSSLSEYINNNTDVGYVIMRHIALTLSGRLQGTNALLKQILWNTNY